MKSQCAEMLKACGGVEVVEKRNYNSQNKKWLPYFINRADQTHFSALGFHLVHSHEIFRDICLQFHY
jgi:hypothetical protein